MTASGPPPRVSVVVLAYGREPILRECVQAVLDGASDDVELVLVDNESPAVRHVPPHPRLRVVAAERNRGFAGGCALGVRHARGEVFVFLNSDAIVEPGAVERLAEAVAAPDVGLASGSIRLADAPGLMNTVGNPVQYLGVTWVGGYGEPAEQHTKRTEVAAASGAFLAVRRDVWDELGGFPREFFAYYEDTELSLRAWQRGYRVLFEPSAVAVHHYVHNRSELKHYLVQRNRLLMVLTVFPGPVLRAVLPALLLYEVGQAAIAPKHRAVRRKLRCWVAIVRRARWIRRRRAEVQAASQMSAERFAALLSVRIEPAMIARPPAAGVLNLWLEAYWRLALRRLHRAGRVEQPGAEPWVAEPARRSG